jgi:serine/threonine protein kinase
MQEVGRRQFQIEGCLGRGGFGEVYRAVMSSAGGLQTEVAVKVLRKDLDPAGQAVQRLRDEGRLLARLNHPTILRVHDLVLLEDRISLVTEFVDGEDLGDLVQGPHRIPLRALLEVISSVAGALDLAWSAPLAPGGGPLELVHRDIKPSNIRISRHGQVKLLDFGIARSDTVDREARTQTNLMVGSPAYMAPERFTENEVHPASDVFALGCALFEGIVGPRLFEGVPVLILSTMALDGQRFETFREQRLGLLPADLPEPVVDLLVRMLDFDPRRRPTAAEVMTRCEELADAVAGDSLSRWCRERPWPEGAMEPGALDGRLITEGTITRSGVIASMDSADAITQREADGSPEVSAASLALDRPASGAGPRLWLALGGVGVAVVAALLVVGGVAGGWALGWFDGAPTEPAADEGAAVIEVGEAGEPEPVRDASEATEAVEPGAVAEPGAGEGEEDRSATTEAAPLSRPAAEVGAEPTVGGGTGEHSAPSEPSAPAEGAATAGSSPVEGVGEPAAPPPAAPVTIRRKAGRVELEGTVAAELISDGERYALPADVPPGTYVIHGMFNGRDYREGGSITVEADATHTVACSARMMRCTVK